MLPKKLPWASLVVLCARSCAESCALGLVRTSCAYVLCGFQNVCEPQTSCARCCADVVRVLCVVFGGDCGLGSFLGWSCALLFWGLGRTIPPPWAHNTLCLDKVLCVSCAPGAFAKKSLGQPCADLFSVDVFFNKTQ